MVTSAQTLCTLLLTSRKLVNPDPYLPGIDEPSERSDAKRLLPGGFDVGYFAIAHLRSG